MSLSLKGKRGLVLGIANRHSIAYGCAKVMAEMGAELCITYLNEKSKPYVEPLAEELGAKLLLPAMSPLMVSWKRCFMRWKSSGARWISPFTPSPGRRWRSFTGAW